ncbi:glycosyltransferase family 4 protein [Muricauda sp. MAR_2010_75]|uniref:glycosyltransferase family 4 protein n=1 Tax=Allomuricauda sp. MAR_2010_75 TaxID=1250232 RepID=UPI0018CECDBD|nr:glycosyltransferase family 4 protein [Muricauda sp. MAR_2010_75]
MYPSKEKAYAGIFVKNQFEELQKQIGPADKLDIFYMKRSFTSSVGSVFKYVGAFFRFIPYFFKRYDVVHVHYFFPLILLAWVKKKLNPNTKIVVTFLGRDINSQVNEKNKAFFQRIAKSVDYSIPVGKTMADQVQKKLNLNKIKILPCGVDSTIFYHEKETQKVYDFISVGSFIHRKGIDTVIEAIKKLPKGSNIKFCFCGSGEYKNQLVKLQNDYNITIKENQTQPMLRTLLNQSRFFLLMSRAEGFATATTEAFFCHVPVLTSDIDNFKEQVTVGKNGYMVPLEDAETLVKKFNELHDLGQEEYGKLQVGASESFRDASLSNVCSEILKIYHELV